MAANRVRVPYTFNDNKLRSLIVDAFIYWYNTFVDAEV